MERTIPLPKNRLPDAVGGRAGPITHETRYSSRYPRSVPQENSMIAAFNPATGLRTLTMAALGALFLVAPLSAQQMPQQQLPDSVQEMVAEFEEKREQLIDLRQEALAESQELQERELAIQDQIEDAMRAVEPDLDELIATMQGLEGDFEAAQQEQDMERLQALMAEAQAVDGRLQQAQAQALEQGEVQETIEQFESDLMDAMAEIEPEAQDLLDRVQELAERLEQINAQGPSPME